MSDANLRSAYDALRKIAAVMDPDIPVRLIITSAECAAVVLHIDALRDALTPLLEEPYVAASPTHGDPLCVFCGTEWREWRPHATACPALQTVTSLGLG